MQGWCLVIVVLLAIADFSNSQYDELSKHQIWQLNGKDVDLVSTKLSEDGLVDVLDLSGARIKMRVSPEDAEVVRETLLREGITYDVLVEDLAIHLKMQELKKSDRVTETCTATSCPEPFKESYMTFEEMEWYLEELQKTYPSRVNITSIGKSVEGRDIWQVHIKSTGCGPKSAVWLEGGIHAREWISPAVTLQLINNLVKHCSIGKLFDVYAVPMANPDGYLYSWSNNRFWRKNRRKNSNSPCVGVDLNRNWDYYYGVGASSNPCSEVFKGDSGFSEPETLALKTAMEKVNETKNLVMVIALHSFGQVLLYPYGWSTTVEAPNTPEMIEKGNIFANVSKISFGTIYTVQNSAVGYSLISGATDDWAKGVLQVKYSYTLELRDEGAQGFTLGTDKIAPTGQEIWEGFMALLYAIRPNKYIVP